MATELEKVIEKSGLVPIDVNVDFGQESIFPPDWGERCPAHRKLSSLVETDGIRIWLKEPQRRKR